MGTGGRADRTERLKELKPGAWGSSSADFAHLIRSLLEHSKACAARIDGNCSPYSLCAIPMLLSSLRCLVVEYASFPPSDADALDELAAPDDFGKMLTRYRVEDPLRSEAFLLQEVRNEIIHPVHRPTGTPDNCPDNLRPLKGQGLFQSTGRVDSDYIFLSQLQSHRLLKWACRITGDVAAKIIQSDPAKIAALGDFIENYKSLVID
jgi:hypothetical protein